jgi:hypothetical protein
MTSTKAVGHSVQHFKAVNYKPSILQDFLLASFEAKLWQRRRKDKRA